MIAVELDADRRAKALRVGATAALDPGTDLAELAEIPGGIRATIDLRGARAGLNTALQIAGPTSTVVMSTATLEPMEIDYGSVFFKGLTLRAAFVGARPADGPADIGCFLQLLADGRLNVSEMVAQVIDPQDAPDLYRRLLAEDPGLGVAPVFGWGQ